MPGCSAHRCGNNSSYTYAETVEKPTFHHFPQDDKIREEWTQILRDQGKKPRRNTKNLEESPQEWTPNYANAKICSDHFEEKYIIKPPAIRTCRSMTTLTEDAIPTLFGEASNKNRMRIISTGAPKNKKQKITNDTEELASTSSYMGCNSNTSSMGAEVSIPEQMCRPIVLGNAILNAEEQTPAVDFPSNDAALEVQMESLKVEDDLLQNIVAFDDTIDNKLQQNDCKLNHFVVFTKSAEDAGSDETAQTMDSQGKVVTLPIGNNQILGLSVLSKLGGEVMCVDKNDGPNPTVYFRTMTPEGSYSMFRAKIIGDAKIGTSGTTSPFIVNDFSDIFVDKISEIEDLVKKFKESSLNQEEYKKLKILTEALDAGEEKKVYIDDVMK